MKRITCRVAVGFVAALFLTPFTALAQITTGTVTGRVVDSTGGVIPSARVILISEARGTEKRRGPHQRQWRLRVPERHRRTRTPLR